MIDRKAAIARARNVLPDLEMDVSGAILDAARQTALDCARIVASQKSRRAALKAIGRAYGLDTAISPEADEYRWL
jgi:hypothetical protein